MLRTRLWMGTILIGLTVGVLVGDRRWPLISPFLFLLVIGLSIGACFELLHLVDAQSRPRLWFCSVAVAILLAINWQAVFWPKEDVWTWLMWALAIMLLSAFAVEMLCFRTPG